MDLAAEVRAVDALARRGAEDDEDRLAHVLLELRARHAAVEVDRDGEPQALAEEVAIVRHASSERRKPALDELLALAARDPRRVVDLFDRERTVVAIRTRDVVRPSRDHHVEHVLPCDQRFLVITSRTNPFVSTPSNAAANHRKHMPIRSTHRLVKTPAREAAHADGGIRCSGMRGDRVGLTTRRERARYLVPSGFGDVTVTLAETLPSAFGTGAPGSLD